MNQTLLQAQHEPRLCHPQSVHCDDRQVVDLLLVVPGLDTHSIGGKTAFGPKKIILREEIESLLKKNSDCTWDWSGWFENVSHPRQMFKRLPLNIFKHNPKHTASPGSRNMCVRMKGSIFSAEFPRGFLPSLLPVAWGSCWEVSGHGHLWMKTWPLAVVHRGDCLLKAALNSAIYSLWTWN